MEELRHLALRQAAPVGELDHLALSWLELFEGAVHAPRDVRVLGLLRRARLGETRARAARRRQRVRCGAAGRRSRSGRPCTASRRPRRVPAGTSRQSARSPRTPPGRRPRRGRGRRACAVRGRRPAGRIDRRGSRTPRGRARRRAPAAPRRNGVVGRRGLRRDGAQPGLGHLEGKFHIALVLTHPTSRRIAAPRGCRATRS